jgi:ribosomal protein S18 acetylase RimI-like enzyme
VADILIRRAQEADADAVGALWAGLVAYHHALDPALPATTPDGPRRYAEALRSHLCSDTTCVFVAERNGVVVGYVLGAMTDMISSWFVHAPTGFIADLYVCPEFQRRGVGRRLVAAMREWFQARGVHQAEWYVAVENEGALAFWRALGGTPLQLRMRATWPEEER